MDHLLVFLVIVTATLVSIWYFTTVLMPSTVTVEVSNETRLLAYTLNKPLTGEHLHVYRPGTHTLGTSRKVLLRVPTTPIILVEQKEQFDTRNVQMEFVYEYELWLVRNNDQGDPLLPAGRDSDEILDWAAKQAYLVYGNPFYADNGQQKNRWVDAIDRTVRLELETIGRMFPPDALTKPEIKKPSLYIKGHTIKSVVSENEPLRLLSAGERFERVTSDEQLFDRIAEHIVEEVNRQHRAEHGLELRPTKFAIHNIEYQDEEMRKVADRRQKALLLIEASEQLLETGRAETPQEAMLIALGQEEKYADLIISTRWQEAVTSTTGKFTADVVERLLKRLER